MILTVVTGNAHKAEEVAAFFLGTVTVERVALDLLEIQSENLEDIAKAKAADAYRQIRKPLIVDDTSFAVDALNGFPGPYAAYVLSTIGNRGILKLMEGAGNRKAHFTTAIGYADENGIRVFTGAVHGTVTDAPRGAGGFGYDPIFEYEGQTLAEMPLAEKNMVSHRSRALAAFHEWFVHERLDGRTDANG